MQMDSKFVEPLIRRAMSQHFPETLHTIMEIIKRIPNGGPRFPKLMNFEEPIRELIRNNIFTINGAPMDPISELDVLQRLTEPLEYGKKEFLDVVFPFDDEKTYDLYCKFVSYCLSLGMTNCLRKMGRYCKMMDVGHPLRVALVNALRNDFCQIAHLNANDLLRLPLMARDMGAVFINTFFYQSENHSDFTTFKVVAQWLVKEPELIILCRPCTAKIVTCLLKAQNASALESELAWRLHFVVIESFLHRKLTSQGVKRPTVPTYMERLITESQLPPLLRLSGADVRRWTEAVSPPTESVSPPTETLSPPTETVNNMLLQVMQVGLKTGNITITKDDMEWCMKNMQHNEFLTLLEKTGSMDVS